LIEFYFPKVEVFMIELRTILKFLEFKTLLGSNLNKDYCFILKLIFSYLLEFFSTKFWLKFSFFMSKFGEPSKSSLINFECFTFYYY